MNDDLTQPHIGQIVDYYPDASTRFAAIIVQSHPSEDSERPTLSLQVFHPNGDIGFKSKVKPVDQNEFDDNNPDQNVLTDRWGYAHEFAILQDEDEEATLGTKTNQHVGTISTNIL